MPRPPDAITARYLEVGDRHRRFSLGRLMLFLGGAFVGVGLIWLVAANLDSLPPLLRFVAVAAIWLALLTAAELSRATGAVRGSLRLMASLAFGAVIFQAAQSLQVPAYAPALIGLWAAGALTHAYAFRALMPLVVGVVHRRRVVDLAAAVGQRQRRRRGRRFRYGGGRGHLPGRDPRPWTHPVRPGLAFGRRPARHGQPLHRRRALLDHRRLRVEPVAARLRWSSPPSLAGLALAMARGRARLEPLLAVAVLAVAGLMVLWDTGTDTSHVDLVDWAHAAAGVVAFVALAVALVAIGTLRDNPVLTVIAMAGLVVFTTFQSFSVFAAIVQGAWLFLVLGLIFLATGFLFDRARREIAASLEDADQEGAGR